MYLCDGIPNWCYRPYVPLGVEGVDTLEEGVEGVEGLLLSSDCALLGNGVPSVVEVRPRLGDVHRLVVGAAARPFLYLDATSLPRLTGEALCFSDGTSGGLRVSSTRAAFFTSLLMASMKTSNFQNQPHQSGSHETSSPQQPRSESPSSERADTAARP